MPKCHDMRDPREIQDKEQSMTQSDRGGVVSLADARAAIPGPQGEHSVSRFQRGTLHVKLSHPVSPNQQTPHLQDEVYVVMRGRGVLLHDGQRDAFESGDLLFVAAGVEHRFEDFSDDLEVWVVFYGPEGGEVTQTSSARR
jgi:mannose-6-phosphate isomerase-like protein (cupin superfamily)